MTLRKNNQLIWLIVGYKNLGKASDLLSRSILKKVASPFFHWFIAK
jgi:hypothetical protein